MKSTLTAMGLLGSFLMFLSLAADGITAEINPKTAMQQAARALHDGHLAEALAGYEKVAADPSKDAAKYKADAIYQQLLLRISADPAVRDVSRGVAIAADLQRTYPAHERAREIAAFAAFAELVQDVERRAADEQRQAEAHLAELAEANIQLKAAISRGDDLSAQLGLVKKVDDSAKLRQDNSSLRAEARNLRDRLAKTQAELQKKDEALKKVAGSMIRPR